MNNFQLNNTNIYLGGQCKWDIILSKYNGIIYISGFQLSPISNNVSFNKKGQIDILSSEHSYALKKFYDELKENFWSIDPDLSNNVFTPTNGEEQNEIIGYCDNSCIAGARRSESYQVYNKQFEYLLPIWLEKVEDGSPIQILFNLIGKDENNNRVSLDSNILEFKKIESNNIRFEFHNRFITYFYNWLKYLNILGEGDDRVLNIDLQNNIAQINGVYTITGQKSGVINCDYVCDNLLNTERPNIEADYILTTLFKNRNMILSQLFNLNFCFNVSDVTDSFFINQLNGKYVTFDCDVKIGDETLSKKTLFNNYQFIQKDVNTPFIFISDMNIERVGGPGTAQTGGLTYGYVEDFKMNGGSININKLNVLDYLRDPYNSDIYNVNKLTQYTNHWGFVSHGREVFNMYEGYCGVSSYQKNVDDKNIIRSVSDGKVTYTSDLFYLSHINQSDLSMTDTNYSKDSGGLNWIYPGNILYVGYNDDNNQSQVKNDVLNNLKTKITTLVSSSQCILFNDGVWDIDNNQLLSSRFSGAKKCKLSFIYLNIINNDWDAEEIKGCFPSINFEYDMVTADNLLVFKIKSSAQIPHYVIVTNDMSNLLISKLNEVASVAEESDFKSFITLLYKTIKSINNDYNFYGFGKELVIGEDELGREHYYKSNSKKTYVYRRCGQLSPYLTDDTYFDINYIYYQSINGMILRLYKDYFPYEYRVMGDNRILSLINNLSFDVVLETKDKSRDEIKNELKEEIKNYINNTYNLDSSQDLIDYIYNLYDVTYNYEYVSEYDIDNTKYMIKLILR